MGVHFDPKQAFINSRNALMRRWIRQAYCPLSAKGKEGRGGKEAGIHAQSTRHSSTEARGGVGRSSDRPQSALRRNVGLVLETRPDHIDAEEIRWMRGLGCTKVQMGAQSLDDRVLKMNRRGHTVAQMRKAMNLLRGAGFKLVLHWMPNLHGATVESDLEDFGRERLPR